MIYEVKPGNHTSVNAAPAVYAGYMAALHRKIHQRWPAYLVSLDTSYPASHPLQRSTLQVTLEFVIEAKTGEFKAVNIVQSSGEMMFDAEAIDTALTIGKQPNPPPQIVSPDGRVYVHWNFWRDGRQCGLFGATIYIVHRDALGNPLPFEADDPDKLKPRETRGMRD
jgi:TonB family protein